MEQDDAVLAAAAKRRETIDGHIADLQKRVDGIKAEGVTASMSSQDSEGKKEKRLSAAVVFLPNLTTNFGQHGEECFCIEMYGEKKPWGCRWFAIWRQHIETALTTTTNGDKEGAKAAKQHQRRQHLKGNLVATGLIIDQPCNGRCKERPRHLHKAQ